MKTKRLQTLRRLSGVLRSPMPITSSPCSRMRLAKCGEIAVGTDQHKAIETPGMQDVHGIDHETNVAGVLALGVCGFLMRDQTEFAHRIGPATQLPVRPVAIDTAQRRLSEGCDFLQNRLRKF